jgi:hypothetical protein
VANTFDRWIAGFWDQAPESNTFWAFRMAWSISSGVDSGTLAAAIISCCFPEVKLMFDYLDISSEVAGLLTGKEVTDVLV